MEKIIYRKTLDVHKNGIQFMLQGFETADKISRVIDICLMASGDSIDFPLEQMTAMMYITTPSATEPSINECKIKNNSVIYDVLPIVEEGITIMQLKLIETSVEGATSVLCSPKFAIEVSKSEAEDSSAEQTTTFTALEDATAKALSTYNSRLLRIEVDDICTFRAYYADGTVYETDTLRKCILQSATEIDLTSLIKAGLTTFTVNEVSEELDKKYQSIFGKAVYVSDLCEHFDKPMFVKWDAETQNTPYTAGLTTSTEGYALSSGYSISTWANGKAFTYSDTHGWDEPIKASGDTMKGALGLGNGKGTVSADDDGAFLATKQGGVIKQIKVMNDSLEESVKLVTRRAVPSGNGTTFSINEYNLIGEHNPGKIGELGYARIQVGSYVGTGVSGKNNPCSLTFDFEPKVIFFSGAQGFAFNGNARFTTSFVGQYSNNITWSGKTVSWYYSGKNANSHQMNTKDKVYHYVAIG